MAGMAPVSYTHLYFSYANTRGTGIVDSNKLQKHNITFRETASFFNDRLKLDGNEMCIRDSINTRSTKEGVLNVELETFYPGAQIYYTIHGEEPSDVYKRQYMNNAPTEYNIDQSID